MSFGFGFSLPGLPNIEATNANFQNNEILEQLGLSAASIQKTSGQAGADMLGTALAQIADPNTAPQLKVALAGGIRGWQTVVAKEMAAEALVSHHTAMFQAILVVLTLADDNIGDYSNGVQLSAQHLTLVALKEALDNAQYAELVVPDLVVAISNTLSASARMAESSDSAGRTAGAVRAESVRNLVRCFPQSVKSLEVLRHSTAVLLRLLNYAREAPLVRLEASQKIQQISNEFCRDAQAANSLWGEQMPGLLTAIKGGSPEMRKILKANKVLYSSKAARIGDSLPNMIEAMGVSDMADILEEVADADPTKLVKSIPALIQELASAPVEGKVLVMGLLLAVALGVGAGSLLPVLGSVSSICASNASLFIPFLKLLTVIASSGEEQAVQCLFLVAKIARSGLVTTPENQSAVLEAVNIIKDKFKYSNIFQTETLTAFEAFAVSNPAAYKNIITWNKGKGAKKGNNRDFLVNAGKVSVKGPGMMSRMLSSTKTPDSSKSGKSGGSVTGSATKLGAVSPSPQSQNMMLLSQSKRLGVTPTLGMLDIDLGLDLDSPREDVPSPLQIQDTPQDTPMTFTGSAIGAISPLASTLASGGSVASPSVGTTSKVLFPPSSEAHANTILSSDISTSNNSDAGINNADAKKGLVESDAKDAKDAGASATQQPSLVNSSGNRKTDKRGSGIMLAVGAFFRKSKSNAVAANPDAIASAANAKMKLINVAPPVLVEPTGPTEPIAPTGNANREAEMAQELETLRQQIARLEAAAPAGKL
ncbi:hypothetical protein B484DRAFT_421144 [Ochromonadaceae sp. CCMP2298]|nr:hypothetical protein B484DRAFT_421144 [Ochromonadaceae sp. CCMP2298]|mmetsp:Transcript_23704/g.52674  ORF Transcript_23704/g.52674 Transcript_23704/m.52674 type:complete len:765 (-) Transcript_23704:1341-3635(-)|eukprot:CAMPEP_0173188702 /NCGR_PEP_ID=MMETSP1141-20130122/11392_1 /TAXON_ID=483371 /ORGANISM="non described non described, Strain CCMP2298" /LENGTH=764 /DNA_ID=CAMNT_0014112641 /DNA_START=117 /DNA_END=2411 /DNA_ORIENTATION=-